MTCTDGYPRSVIFEYMYYIVVGAGEGRSQASTQEETAVLSKQCISSGLARQLQLGITWKFKSIYNLPGHFSIADMQVSTGYGHYVQFNVFLILPGSPI